MTRRRETLGRALACACIAALTLGATAAWSQAASFQPKTSRTGRTAMTIAQTAMKQETMSRDLANRSPDIHWPEGFSPDQADLFSHNELRIEASCERVWKHIVEATKWPQWVSEFKGCSDHRRWRRAERRQCLPMDNLRPAAGESDQ